MYVKCLAVLVVNGMLGLVRLIYQFVFFFFVFVQFHIKHKLTTPFLHKH